MAGSNNEKKKRDDGARKLTPYKMSRRAKITIVALMVLALITEFVVFLAYSTVDKRFIRDMDRGIKTGWEHPTGEAELVNIDGEHDLSFIEDEYKAVKDYSDREFQSRKLEKLAKQYVDAVINCEKVVKKYDIDKQYSEFWQEFSPYYGERIKAVYSIYKARRYGLRLEDQRFGIQKENLLVQGWALNKTTDTVFKRTEDKNGTVFEAELRNDSGYDLTYLDFEIELYDDKDNLIETESAYAQNIKKGEEVKLTFNQMYPAEAKKYIIASVICETMDQHNREKKIGTGKR